MAEKFEYTREWTDEKAFPRLGFTKNWENPDDYPTVELDETKVRKDMQSLHDEVKDYINDKLIPAVLAEDATEEARAAAEEDRANAEAERQSAEDARASAETTRQSNEETRESNEASRVAAENARVNAESAREQEESGRVTAEEARAEAENLRQEAEASRDTAEIDRMSDHLNWRREYKLWEDSERSRVSHETARVSAEQDRVSAEQDRVIAENARVTAEQGRETAEQARVDADIQRTENSEQVIRDSAQYAYLSKAYASGQGSRSERFKNIPAGSGYFSVNYDDNTCPYVEVGRTYRVTVNGETVETVATFNGISALGVTITEVYGGGYQVKNNNDYDVVSGSYETVNTSVYGKDSKTYSEEAKLAANEAEVFTNGGEFIADQSVHSTDGAKNYAEKAKAFADGGSYLRYGGNGLYFGETVEKGAKQYAEDAATAKTGAETAKDAAVTAQGKAEDAKKGAEVAKTASEASKEVSAKSEAAAKLSEQNAKASEDAAKASEANAAGSASAAAESATAAQTAQSGAEAAKTAASQSAQQAAESAAVYDSVVTDVGQLKQDLNDKFNSIVNGFLQLPNAISEKFINAQGELVDNTVSTAYRYIPVEIGKTYIISNAFCHYARSVVAYNSDKTFNKVILTDAGSDLQNITITVDDYAFIGISGKIDANQPTVEVKNGITGFTALTDSFVRKNVKEYVNDNSVINVDKSLFIQGYLYPDGIGVVDSPNYKNSPFIEVSEMREITIYDFCPASGKVLHLYDENKNVISNIDRTTEDSEITSATYSIPVMCKYIRFNIRKEQNPSVEYADEVRKDYRINNVVGNWYETSRRRIAKLFSTATMKPICCIIDDDTQTVDYVNKFVSVCENNGIKGTMACLTSNLPSVANALKSAERNGYQIVLHGYNQIPAYQNMSDSSNFALAEDDFVHGLSDLVSNGFCNPKFWVTPYGVTDINAQKLARKWGMECLVGVTANEYETTDAKYGRFALRRSGLNATDKGGMTQAQLLAMATECASVNGWLLVCTHVYDGWGDDFTRFNDFVTHCKNLGYEFMTLGEAWEIRKPIYDWYDNF